MDDLESMGRDDATGACRPIADTIFDEAVDAGAAAQSAEIVFLLIDTDHTGAACFAIVYETAGAGAALTVIVNGDRVLGV